MLWKKTYELSLNRVRDTVRVREGDEAITLTVDADPMRIVTDLNAARAALQGMSAQSAPDEQAQAARLLASAIFGPEQSGALIDFYHGDATCVINVCGRYFSERLSGLIAKAQKR